MDIDPLSAVLIIGLGIFLKSYLDEKAKNLATKEEIEEITGKVESLKATIGSQQFIHQTRYQNEFKILMELSEKIIALSDAARSMRPEIDSYDPNELEEDRKNRRLSEYHKASSDFYHLFQTRQAFYPEDIYKALQRLDYLAYKEAVQYRRSAKVDTRDRKYWEDAKKNSDDIYNLSNEVIGLIRDRVKYWEDFEYRKENGNIT